MFRVRRPIALLFLALAGVSSAEPSRNISFLGSNAVGRSVVIVIDYQAETSESWRELRLQTASNLRSLSSDQSFNIILAQERDCLALSANALFAATPGNIDDACDTMSRWRSLGRSDPIPALELAFRLKPDIIFLLAGKDFAGPGNDAVARACAQGVRGGAPKINTIALEEYVAPNSWREPAVGKCLRDIARDSGGRFHLAGDVELYAETPPERTLAIRRGTWSSVIGFAPDNKTAYVTGAVNQVNVWETIVYYWSELTAAVPGLILLRILIRAARNRHEPGEQYCRRCDYNIRGLPGSQCPECGTQLTAENRIAGRSRRPRLAVAGVLLVCVAGAYGFAATRLPRQGSAGQWIDWRSISLADWATTGKRHWLLRHTTLDEAILRVDLDAGKILRVHCRIPHKPDEDPGLAFQILSADGRTLLCGVPGGSVQVDCATGKVIHHYDFRCSGSGFTRIGTRILFDYSKRTINAWDLRTGQRMNATTVDIQATLAGVISAAGRELAVILTDDKPGTIVRVWDPLDGTFVQMFRVQSRSICCDGNRLYAALDGNTDLTIETWDVLTGRRQRTAPTGQTLLGHLTLAASNDWLVATDSDRETLAINLRTGAHRSWLMRYPRPTVSPDGRHVIGGAYCGAGRFDEVCIHDLP